MSRQGLGARWLALLAVLVVCGSACEHDKGAPEEPTRAPLVARDGSLIPVLPPRTGGLERMAQDVLRDREARLQALLADPGASKPALAGAYGELGKAYLAFELYEPAAECFENAGRLAPGELAWPYLLARARTSLEQLDAAVAALGKALALEPANLQVLLYLGEVETAAGRIDRARGAYDKALAASPDCAPASFALGRIALLTGDAPRAIAHLEKALAAEPSANRIHSLLADAYRQVGDTERSRLQRAKRGDRVPALADPLVDEVAEINPRNYAPRALQALRSGNAARAVALLRAESAAIPEDAEVRIQLGIALGNAGAPREAIQQFREALRLQPENPRALYQLGIALASAGRSEDAVLALRQALVRSPESAPTHLALAKALRRLGRHDDALQSLERAVRFDPTSVEARLERGRLLADLGRCRDAAADLEKSLVAFPGDASLVALRAEVLAACPGPAGPHP